MRRRIVTLAVIAVLAVGSFPVAAQTDDNAAVRAAVNQYFHGHATCAEAHPRFDRGVRHGGDGGRHAGARCHDLYGLLRFAEDRRCLEDSQQGVLGPPDPVENRCGVSEDFPG
jgi:hypothetical protein